MAQPAPSLLTAAEYLAIERSSPTKHELFQGQLLAMAGASLEHNVIVANFVATDFGATDVDSPTFRARSLTRLGRSWGHHL